jgi:iron complex outermembrane receptor protein
MAFPTGPDRTAALQLVSRRAGWMIVTVLLVAFRAASQQGMPADLTEMSLEDLLNIEVTSVARREQKLSQSASAVYVITQEDIRRSGVTTIPDALRMAPGVQVAQVDGSKWAISIRGFTGRFANKLLVMIDGRSVYSPLFAGVYWEANDVLLEDVERIEVIRGPGATMWGSNAVNGVINIITKPARHTQGGLVSGGGGNQEGGFGAARFGAQAGSKLHYRVYSKYFSRSALLLDSGERAPDDWQKLRGGFRLDWQASSRDEVLLSGDSYQGEAGARQGLPAGEPMFQQTLQEHAKFSGANLMGRWTRRHSDRSRTQLQAFFEHTEREDLYQRPAFNVGDIEFQHALDFSRHEVMWGAGYRLTTDKSTPTQWLFFDPAARTTHRGNAFLQDRVALLPDKLLLTLGSKFERNTFTGWEIQPSVSLLWNRGAAGTVWVSASRAVRTPSRGERDVVFDSYAFSEPDGSVFVTQILGTDAFRSERLWSYEAGYRFTLRRQLSFDLTTFYNAYDGIAGLVDGVPFVRQLEPPTFVVPLIYTNVSQVDFYGAELAAMWNPFEAAGLRLSYSWLGGQFDGQGLSQKGPAHRLHARWYWTVARNLEWDSGYYFVAGHSGVAAYSRVDSRLGWRPARHWDCSLVLQNLLDGQHREEPLTIFIDQPSEVGRSIFGKVSWRF